MTIDVRDSEGVRTLTLNRPDRLNSMTGAMVKQLREVLLESSRDPGVRCLVVTGAGRAFCSGHDLGGDNSVPDPIADKWQNDPIWWEPEQAASRIAEDNQIPILLHRMSKPTIASMRGAVAGSGFVLAAACDLRIASDTAFFKSAFASAGRCGDPGGSFLITHLVGSARAREIYLLDEKIPAEKALGMGLVSKVVPDADLESATAALATKFAKGAGLAYAGIKRNLNAAATGSLEDTMMAEGPINVRASLSHDGKEAGKAFMEKRPPNFRGY
jgi:2-(1,2-epoxy-1,2-dihydrophenyl)acetyl-CoA isomerase